MPESYCFVVNTDLVLVKKLIEDKDKKLSKKLTDLKEKEKLLTDEKDKLSKENEKKKEEEIPQADRDRMAALDKDISVIETDRKKVLKDYAGKNKLVRQLIDLALLSNNMLTGEALTNFVKRSVELIK
jgi:molecular chaperone HtpG